MTPEIERRVEVLESVRRLLIEDLKVRREPDEIDPDTVIFGSGLGLDSVDAVELLVGLETRFGVRADEQSMRVAMRTVSSLVDFILATRTP